MKIENIKRQTRLFPYLLLLTFFYLLSHVTVFLMANNSLSLLSELTAKSAVTLPAAAILGQVQFVSVILSAYALFAVCVWCVTRLMGYALALPWQRTWRLGIVLWTLAALTVLVINGVYFTGASMTLVVFSLLPMGFLKVMLWVLLALCALAMALACYGLLKYLFTMRFRALWIVVPAFAVMSVALHSPAQAKTPVSDQPNVIILSVDSLRPDFIGPLHERAAGKTPFYDFILPKMTYFTDAYTVQARTYPSWAAILTGLYPKYNRARFNLAPETEVNVTNTLGHRLQKAGYYTIYATDGRQFNAINDYFGFNKTIGPPANVNNYLLSDINDLPLTNLLINTRLGQHLFPFNYANRDSTTSYMPSTFDSEVERVLSHTGHRPIFFAVHLCLPHFPYTWNDADQSADLFPVGLYERAVARSDRQVQKLYNYLERHHFLDHAIIIILSDHGESLCQHGDRLISKAKYIKGPHSRNDVFKLLRTDYFIASSPFDGSYGHGTDVLAQTQNHVVLGFELRGFKKPNVARSVDAPVGTIDIKPTILSLLGLQMNVGQGQSLTPYIYGKRYDGRPRARFVESGYSPGDDSDTTVDLNHIALEGLKFFKVQPSGSVVFRDTMMARALHYKQRAVFYGDWALAIYVKHNKPIPVLVNMKTGHWTDDLQSEWAQHSPVKLLFAKLKAFYGNEITIKPQFD